MRGGQRNNNRYYVPGIFDAGAWDDKKMGNGKNIMRVEAIVKKDGWFIPHPGFPVGRQKHILLDITPVTAEAVSDDVFVQAAGILKKTTIDGAAFQKKLRKEWNGR